MYTEHPDSILIVKTSSLGDILQSLPVLDYLRNRFPAASIDWAVARKVESAVAFHPLIRRAIPLDLDIKKPLLFARSLRRIRKNSYDLLFDLQGNCKSGLVTLLARARCKVGFSWRSAREWPNCLATTVRIDVPKHINMRFFYLKLVQQFFCLESVNELEIDTHTHLSIGSKILFRRSAEEIRIVQNILESPMLQRKTKIMVCPGSRWPNKQPSMQVLGDFLVHVIRMLDASFLLIWGGEQDRFLCEQLREQLVDRCLLADKLTIPAWHSLMQRMDAVIAIDSSALHLCGAAQAPSFSLFGPTSSHVFKPLGPQHGAVQGICPYGRVFEKQCPILRTCPTGACMRDLRAEEIFLAFQAWWQSLNHDAP